MKQPFGRTPMGVLNTHTVRVTVRSTNLIAVQLESWLTISTGHLDKLIRSHGVTRTLK